MEFRKNVTLSAYIPLVVLLIHALVSKTVLAHSNLIITPSPSSSSAPSSSPFEFLKNVQGCRKGDKVKGIRELKVFLKRFGYLSDNQSNRATDSDAAADDYFDDITEFAVKTYQINFNLKPSGVLDAETVLAMSTPRCGVADNVNGTTRMNAGKKLFDPRYSHSHFSFFPGNPVWPSAKFQLQYGFPAEFPSKAVPLVANAFASWKSVTPFTFVQAASYDAADVKISFQLGDHGDGHPFDGPGGVLAHAFSPTDGRLHFDNAEKWSEGRFPDAFDVQTIGLHEIGHILGLQHSSDPNAIMFPTFAPETTKGLGDDDIQGIKALYGGGP